MGKALQVNSGTFKEEILDYAGLALVDFWAEWCGPCKMLSPIVDDLAVEYKDKVKIVGLDVDGSADIAGQYGIQAIPTLLFFRGGRVVEQVLGLQSKDALKKKIELLSAV